jgi:hypothetical protein
MSVLRNWFSLIHSSSGLTDPSGGEAQTCDSRLIKKEHLFIKGSSSLPANSPEINTRQGSLHFLYCHGKKNLCRLFTKKNIMML